MGEQFLSPHLLHIWLHMIFHHNFIKGNKYYDFYHFTVEAKVQRDVKIYPRQLWHSQLS
jgi:hypothetical protein